MAIREPGEHRRENNKSPLRSTIHLYVYKSKIYLTTHGLSGCTGNYPKILLMATRISLTSSKDLIEERFRAEFDVEFLYEPVYLINGNKQEIFFIVAKKYQNEILPAMSGLIPESLMRNPKLLERKYGDYSDFIKNKQTYWAEAEQVLTKRFYRESVLNNRCLIIADGFFLGSIHNQSRQVSYHYIPSNSNGRKLFAIAGIYSQVDNDLFSCSIINVPSNEYFIPRSRRIPLVLDEELEGEWLRGDLHKEGLREILKAGFTSADFNSHVVDGHLLSVEGQMKNPLAIKSIE